MPYHLAPPQGWEAFKVFENLAASNEHSAFSQKRIHFTQPRAAVLHDPSEHYAKLRQLAETHANLGWLQGGTPLGSGDPWNLMVRS
jgi:hypothetical protein